MKIKKTESGWKFIGFAHEYDCIYYSLVVGIQQEILKPIFARFFCLFCGHTYGQYDRCSLCERKIQ